MVLAALASCTAAWLGWRFTAGAGLASFADDGVSYMIMAQAYSPYQDAAAAVARAFHFESYPPLFPLALALLGGAHDFARAHLVVVMFFAAGVFASYLFARARRLGAGLALAIAIAVALAPGAWLGMLRIISENLYVALLLLALYVYEQNRATGRMGYMVVFAVLLAATAMTRSVGIALTGAYVAMVSVNAVSARRLPGWRWIAPLFFTAAVLAGWYLLRPVYGADQYVADVERILPRMAEEGVAGYFASNVGSIIEGWYTVTIGYWTAYFSPMFLLATLFGLLALHGMVRDLRANRLAGWYVITYLVILLLWPHPGQMIRFVGALLPVLLVLALESAAELVRRFLPARGAIAASVSAALLLVTVIPSTAFYLTRAGQASPLTGIAEYYYYPDLSEAKAVASTHHELFGDMQRIAMTTPPDAVIMWYTPNYISLLTNRHAVAAPAFDSVAQFYRAVAGSGADYVFLAQLNPRDTRKGSNGMFNLPWFEPYCDMVWQRGSAEAGPQSMLLRIDRNRLLALIPD